MLHDDGMSYGDYVEQLTYLLFREVREDLSILKRLGLVESVVHGRGAYWSLLR